MFLREGSGLIGHVFRGAMLENEMAQLLIPAAGVKGQDPRSRDS